jgi:HlyD family secretion protein
MMPLVGSCASGSDGEDEGQIEIVAVERGSLVSSVTAIGTIAPAAEVTLSFEIGGRVSEVMVQTGEQVEEGQALARLDTADLELQVQGAEAALMAAQAQLDQLRAGARADEITIAEAQLDAAQSALAQAIAHRDQLEVGTLDAEIAAAEAQVAAARAEERLAREAHDQTMRCYELPDGTEICPLLGTQEEQARAGLSAASEALEASQLQLSAVEGGAEAQLSAANAAVWGATAQRDIAQAQLDLLVSGATEADFAVTEANVAGAEVALESARLALERATLRAPFDGVVGRVDVMPSQYASPQMPALTVVDSTSFTIEADVDEADIGWVEEGQDVQITLDAFPGRRLTGTVTAIAPSGTFDGGVVSYRVKVEIAPTDLPLRSGMTANAEIVGDRREDVLLVPNRAIWVDPDTGQTFVEKMVDEEILIATIDQGLANEEVSEVLDGLEEGDQLVVRSVSVRERFRRVVTMPMSGE